MRKNSTDAECVLWQQLRSKQLGVKFRRQHSIGDYIVDFYCPAAKLVIECDGGQHYESAVKTYDDNRSDDLKKLGIMVKRYDNHSVLTQTDMVIEDILRYLLEIDPTPTLPSDMGGN